MCELQSIQKGPFGAGLAGAGHAKRALLVRALLSSAQSVYTMANQISDLGTSELLRAYEHLFGLKATFEATSEMQGKEWYDPVVVCLGDELARVRRVLYRREVDDKMIGQIQRRVELRVAGIDVDRLRSNVVRELDDDANGGQR